MLKRLKPLVLLALVLPGMALSGCSWAPPQQDIDSGAVVAPAEARSPSARAEANPVLTTARQMIGVAYNYGGHSPATGFDCSGLVYYAHRTHGISVPRTARAQYGFSKKIPREALRPGDLLFFRTSGRRVSHVGLYLGPGRFLHAPGSGKHVTIADYRSTYWRARFAGAGRIPQAQRLRTSAAPSPR